MTIWPSVRVAAVITMLAVGGGAQARVAEQIQSLGSNLISVLSGSVISGGVRLGSGSQLTISEDDAASIQRDVGNVQAFAAMIGIFFGFYPARKASHLDPVEAMRYE